MALHTVRWLSCDFPGCVQTFEPTHYRAVVSSTGAVMRGIRDGAKVLGWDHTDEGEDLCKRHADARRGREIQPPLFPVPDGDHTV